MAQRRGQGIYSTYVPPKERAMREQPMIKKNPTVKDHLRNAYEAISGAYRNVEDNRRAYNEQKGRAMDQQIKQVQQEAKLARAQADVQKARGYYQPSKLDTIFRQDHPLVGPRINKPWWME